MGINRTPPPSLGCPKTGKYKISQSLISLPLVPYFILFLCVFYLEVSDGEGSEEGALANIFIVEKGRDNGEELDN